MTDKDNTNFSKDYLRTLEKKGADIRNFIDVSAIITSALDINEVIKLIMEKLKEIIDAEACSILVYNRETNKLEFEVAISNNDSTPNILKKMVNLDIGQGIAGWVAEKRKPLNIKDVKTDRRFYNEADKLTGFITKNLIAVPLVGRRRLIGVAEIINSRKKDFFSDYDLEIFKSLSTLIAIAIENASLYKERIEMQEKIIRSEKLAAVGKIVGSIGHDLRNPLNNINNSASYLSEMLEDADEKVKKQLDIILKAVDRSGSIINDLLDLSRTKPLCLVKCNVNDIVKETLSDIETPENIRVETQLEEYLPEILLDPYQTQRVFLNIISNAFRAMPEGGNLKISTSHLSLVNSHLKTKEEDVISSPMTNDQWPMAERNFVEISFTDTGHGIPDENLQKIFEPLFTTRSKGIGLGMAIVNDIIEKHKGTIDVQSEVGKGTIFVVKLPIKNIIQCKE